MKNKDEAVVCAVKQVIAYNPLVWAQCVAIRCFPYRRGYSQPEDYNTEMDYDALKGIRRIRAEAKSLARDHSSRLIQVSGLQPAPV